MKEFRKGDLVNWHSVKGNIFWCLVIKKVYPNQYRLISSGGSVFNIDEDKIESTNVEDVVKNNRKAWGYPANKTIQDLKEIYTFLGIVCPEEITNLERSLAK